MRFHGGVLFAGCVFRRVGAGSEENLDLPP